MNELTAIQQSALDKILALRHLTHTQNVRTTRSQNTILASLPDADLAIVAVELEKHLHEFGW